MKNIKFIIAVVILAVCSLPAAQMVVNTLNGESGNVNLVAGSNVTITPSGQSITVSATDSPQVSIVVAKQSFVGESADISLTTIYTPPSDGDFRISEFGTSCPPGNGFTVSPIFSWTDPGGRLVSTDTNRGTGTSAIPALPCDATFSTYNYNTLVAHAKGGLPISFKTSGGAPSFSMYVTIERMGN